MFRAVEEIQEAVSEARRQWRTAAPAKQMRLFEEPTPVERQERFDLSGITDAQFFEQAEAKVVGALRIFAEQSHNGQLLQRRLFVDDAVRGFGFVDTCHKRFDVVLMNPPFGELPTGVLTYLKDSYRECGTNLAGIFLGRTLQLLGDGGCFGFVGPRSTLFLRSLEGARTSALLINGSLRFTADLGLRVMDDAWIESCALVADK